MATANLAKSSKNKQLAQRRPSMPKSQIIDQELLNEAILLGGLNTKKATVNQTLKEFIQRRKQREIIELFGTMPMDEDYDYKKARQ